MTLLETNLKSTYLEKLVNTRSKYEPISLLFLPRLQAV